MLAVLRPPDDPELPDVWGLPATTLRAKESWEEALARAGRDKLGVTLEPHGILAEGEQDRPLEGAGPVGDGSYRLRMRVYEVELPEGEPREALPSEGRGTRYVSWRWAEPDELREAAGRGSLCTQLYLKTRDPDR